MGKILTVEEAARWKHRFLDWRYDVSTTEVKVLFDSHEALRAQDEAKVELISRLSARIVDLTAGLRDTLVDLTGRTYGAPTRP